MPEKGLWHLRITYGDCSLNEIVSLIKDKTECILLAHENDEDKRPHIHCCIVEFKQSKSTFIQQLKKKFPIKGSDYSCHTKDDQEAQLRYMCKGLKDTMPQILHKHDDVDVEKYYKGYWEENSKLLIASKTKKEEEAKEKAKKKPVKSWLERTYDVINEEYPVEVLAVQTYHLVYNPSTDEKAEYHKHRKVLFRKYMRCMGAAFKKVSIRIHEENFNGIINAICQNDTHLGSGIIYSDNIYKAIWSY